MKAGLIGCGNIGTELALFIDKNKLFPLSYVNDLVMENAAALVNQLKNYRPEAVSFDELVNGSDMIIEAAGKDAAEELLRATFDKKKKIMIMSAGGCLKCTRILEKSDSDILIPSGAVCGLDGIKSAAMERIDSVIITTTKPARTLESAPYVLKNKIDLGMVKDKKVIFEGNLADAIEGFPKNINVAATLFLASGFSGLKIRIVADSRVSKNIHEVEVNGAFGRMVTTVENIPSKNPSTSYLATLSAKRMLLSFSDKVRVGN